MRRTAVIIGMLLSFGLLAAAQTVPAWRTHLPIPIATLREAFEHWDRDLADESFITVLGKDFFLDHPQMDWETLGDLRRYVRARFDWAPLAPVAIDLGLIRPTQSDHLGMRVLLLYAKWKGSSRLEWDGITWPAAVLDARAERRRGPRPTPVCELDIPVEEFHRDECADEVTLDAPQGIQ